MSAFDDHKDEIEHYEQMLGRTAAASPSLLTGNKRDGARRPTRSLLPQPSRPHQAPPWTSQIITDELRKAKELIQSVMEDLRTELENRLRAN